MVYAICGLAVLGAHLGNPAAAPDPVAEGYVHCKDPGHDEDSVSREADALDNGPRDDSSRYDGEGPYVYFTSNKLQAGTTKTERYAQRKSLSHLQSMQPQHAS